MRRILVYVFFLLFTFPLIAQDLESEEGILSWYDEQLGVERLGFVNGPIYQFQRASPFTHRFFSSQKWVKGNILVKGQEYKEVDILYDLQIDSLVMRHPNPLYTYGIALKNVDGFSMYESQFTRLKDRKIKDGFYEILFLGDHLELYSRWEKEEKFQDNRQASFSEKRSYYWKHNGSFIKYQRIKSLYAELKDEKAAIRRIKKEYKLKPTTARPGDISKLFELLDQTL